jgi:hypothetical protein
MQKWEYYTFVDTEPISEQALMNLGAEGWELVAIAEIRNWTHYYFKRQIP